ncbi:DUF6075 family protein [Paenibacillus koleovorans]|uniref:DUF6075 family protein n=1 Tax=Paenibacillus koleovorans TaxID=121608 RepID=UPI0035A22656
MFYFFDGGIKLKGMSASWQTGGSLRICRLAFNFWNGLFCERGRTKRSGADEARRESA